jgi:4-hydroxy-2-oxoheptanedioate aldolase
VILQTESPEGVDNAEAIYSLPGVDGIFVGPNDLFWQMKKPDGTEPTPAEFEAMLQRILAAGKKTGTPVGIHCQSVDEIKHRISEGWQFLAMQSELKMMVTKAQEIVQDLGLSTADDLVRY